jgi:hypothetical protein
LKGIGGILSSMELTAHLHPTSRLRIIGAMSLLPPPLLYVVHMNNLIFVDDCKKQELDEFGHTNVWNYQFKKNYDTSKILGRSRVSQMVE